jgi:hypothetical protein
MSHLAIWKAISETQGRQSPNSVVPAKAGTQ